MENYNGIAEDPRSEEEKAQDYIHEDLASGVIDLVWIEHDHKILRSFELQNQDGSSSCVAQATAKILAIHEVQEGKEYKRLCPKFIYTRRQNYPSGGMYLPGALSIACKNGACEEVIQPCDFKGESFMNQKTEPVTALQNADKFKGKYYFQITGGIDKIAEVIEQGYGVLLGFHFDRDEWTDVPFINPSAENKIGHGVAAVDYGLYNGQKALVIEDSWDTQTGRGKVRIITEEFLNKKCFYAGYVTSLPNYTFTKVLRFGSKGIDVRKLQEKLWLHIDGVFGNKTLAAVKKFQSAHGLYPDGIVGRLTNIELNK